MQENSSIKRNILQFLDFKGISKYQFYKNTGITRGVLDSDGGMSEDNTARFIAYYPEVSIEWLITGKGDMLKNEPKEYTQKEEIINTLAESESNIKKYNFKSDYFNINNQLIPLYEIEAVAGLNTLFSNQIDQSPIDYISVPNAPKCDGALFVRGDSMYPIMKSGDIVCYKQIKDTQNNIRFGEIYLLYIDDGDDEYLTIKYVQLSDRGKDYVKLVSQNQYHAPKDEHISHIKGLAIIKLSIRYNTIS
ncbi:S24 family peptidase [Dysgonomonas sp. HGC4]|uniref:S24 family peptidase n=2 Tax=Dysgonomonas sp. HGC4 TaxID=1658009 RepID=UPI00067FD167|nr:S24 family peptidase [Dysgonomonas sp. HGC4]